MGACHAPVIREDEMMAAKATYGPHHPLVEHWDDERSIGNGIIVTLKPGHHWYDDCGVMGFDTAGEAKRALRDVAKACASIPTPQPESPDTSRE